MEHKIPCEIIRDLLPLYVDGLTSEKTDEEVRAHLENCQSCREQYGRMSQTITEEEQSRKTEDIREIDYLNKVKKRSLGKAVACLFLGVALIVAAIALKLFVLGYPVNNYSITYTDVSENHLSIGGMIYDSSSVYKKYRIVTQEDGTSKLVIYGCLSNPWNRDGSFNLDIDMSEVEGQLDINGITVDKDGTIVSKLANNLYAAKNPYVGDMPANGRLAMILGVAASLGNFDNELQTDQEPYGWTLNFHGITDEGLFNAQIKDYACVLIALIDNLDEVSWTYTEDADDGAIAGTGRLTLAECTQAVGEDIKGFSQSPEDVQRLLDKLIHIRYSK